MFMTTRRTNDPLESMAREFDRVLGRFGGSELPAQLAPYAVDVHEDADHITVEAELPGFTKDDVDITLEEGVLTIRAERKVEEKRGSPLHVERRWTQFQRAFSLPTAVNESSVRAELTDGVLTVTMDKREEVKPRKIAVSVGNGKPKAQVTDGASRKESQNG